MADVQNQVVAQEKKEVESKNEHTKPLKRYVPATDIVETEKELLLYMDMPGVGKDNVNVKLEKSVLKIEGQVNMKTYSDLKPLYTEYNIGNYSRSFELSKKIDQTKIEAKMEDGVLFLTLPKVPEMQPRNIAIN